MTCEACNKVNNPTGNEDCFEKALEMLKNHYTYYKSTLHQRDIELQQIKERNEKLNKALNLLQKYQQAPKRFKTHHSSDPWVGNISSQGDYSTSDLSLTDDEPIAVTNLNIALNSEQLFDTSGLSQTKNDLSTVSSSEIVQTPWIKESPKRNKQRDAKRYLKDRNKSFERPYPEWHKKERNNSHSWSAKFLQPMKSERSDEKLSGESKKAVDKKMCLSLSKTNAAKIKQSLLPYNKSKDLTKSDGAENIIDASPVLANKNSKAMRSWAHRNDHIYNSNCTTTETKKDVSNKTLDDIVFDFSPSKKVDLTPNLNPSPKLTPKKLNFESDSSKECMALSNENLLISTNNSNSSSLVILTPASQDIIFVDDTEIDTMDLLADVMKSESTDNLEKLKKYESKCIQDQQKNKETNQFKIPTAVNNINTLAKIKQERITQENIIEIENPSCSRISSHIISKNPKTSLLSSDEQDTDDDEDCMPKPITIKQELESCKDAEKFSIKKRFNVDCEDCEKLINFLDERLTDAQIQQHLNKCKRHNNPEIMRQNTPKDFWNPFILSFQPDDPRNVVLIDERFKNNKD